MPRDQEIDEYDRILSAAKEKAEQELWWWLVQEAPGDMTVANIRQLRATVSVLLSTHTRSVFDMMRDRSS